MAITMLTFSACNPKTKVDLLVVNANIYTADSNFSKATTMAINNGLITYIGTESTTHFEAGEIIDAGGKTIVPGLIDAHCHFTGYGDGLISWANLGATKSWEEVIERLKQFQADNPGTWLLGRGWDQNDWASKQFPDNTLLDQVFGDLPVALTRIDGHAMIANSAALRLANITPKTLISGGEIRTAGNRLTGLLLDNAMERVYSVIPELSNDQRIQGLVKAQENCLAVGLTALSDAGLSRTEIFRIDSLQKAGILKMRINAWLNPNDENLKTFVVKGPMITPLLQVTAIKLYADGALGSRGAWLLEPYTDDPKNNGIATFPETYFDEWATTAADNHFQLCVHAIGDAANRMVLKVYSKHLSAGNDRRWRIEHAQVVDSADFDAFGRANIIASMQPTHATSDMYWAEQRLGSRVANAYALKRLMLQNDWMPLGTDFPIEHINPALTFFAAVARKDTTGFPAAGFRMDDALSRQEALWGMTLWAARANFTEKINGSLETGKAADFVMFDEDLMTADEMALPHLQVLMTVIDGKVVYKNRNN